MALRFFHRVITSLEDATHNFEQLEKINPLQSGNNLSDVASTVTALDNLGALAAAENLAELANRATARTNLGIASGTDTFTFAASQTSNTRTVTHGLHPATPQIILLSIQGGFGAVAAIAGYYFSVGDTTFQAQAVANTAITASPAYSWLAIG